MLNINAITPSATTQSSKSLVEKYTPKLATNKWIEKIVVDSAKTSQKSARFLVISNVLKDAINCFFYTYQSLTNKRIPEDKRGFVAAVDLVNGILMCASQYILGFGVTSEKAQAKIANVLLPKDLKKHNFERYERCASGIKTFTGLVVATIFAKRMLVPFLSVPIAGPVKKKLFDKKPDKQAGNNPAESKQPENKQPLNKTV